MTSVHYQGLTFYRNQHRWLDENYLEVSSRQAHELDQQFPTPSNRDDRRRRLAQARAEGRAVFRAEDTDDPVAVAVLCGTFRDRRWYHQALQLTDRWKNSNHSGVLLARAAVLCDLGRMVEGHDLAHRAAELGGGYAATNLLRRISREWGHQTIDQPSFGLER